MIDLRSDTVTRPTAAMREAMARAEVGDDVYGEDPTVARLEKLTAEITGKAAALFVPSGTMSNQIALLCHTQRGDEVIIGEGAHCAFYESGAGAAWSGVQFEVAGRGGLFGPDELKAVIKPPADYHPRTRVVALENTHNRAGGRVFPQRDVLAIGEVARAHGLAMHLDGARVWNASVASGLSVAELCAPFETVSVCFSKGLGAPVGSAICGDAATIVRARRFRKMLGGGMRQVGVLAAGALYAVEHHRARLAEDHAAARVIGAAIREVSGASVPEVETNLVQVDLPVAADELVAAARARGVLVGASGARRVRVVTHLDLPAARVAEAAAALAEATREVVTRKATPA
ncbi:low-specificity L-threonine aldolase [Polyangium mundeleinium]|uniref:Low-specificity L-threonine aldolase n=1 Tax=Polyangium mundeleinium TaxID=2995306 RepID=A0ABT5EL82_9BACT|nr:low-specificity L-threonine aldolase [Polyangium mundeleinium]MDC0742132.1 low-specificity L-threonine aldolase [Polyangium mundeleinium]